MDAAVLGPPPPLGPADAAALLEVAAGTLDDAEVADRVVALHRLRAVVDAAIVATTEVLDRRAVWSRDGARNAPGWVAARTSASYGAAKADVRLARDLREMPATEAAFASGRIGREQVRLLAAARGDGLEEAFAACEEVLVEEVARSTVAAGARFLRRWAAEVRQRFGIGEPDGAAPGAADRSQVHLSCTFEGRWRVDGTLSPEAGEVVTRAIDAQVDAMWGHGAFHADDGLTPAERRAVALVEVVTRGTRGGDDDGTARPLVLGVVHLRSAPPADPVRSSLPVGLSGRPPVHALGLAELATSGVVDGATAERWICEGTVQLVEVGHRHDELRMGRKIRTANRSQRRALRIRDGGCTFPTCSAGPEHCVAHHVRWWEWGGPTDIENLVLLCRFHHRAVHERGFVLTRRHGRVEVTRPDGAPLTAPLRTRPDPSLRPTARDPVDHPPGVEVEEVQLCRQRGRALVAAAHRARDPVGRTPHPSL